MLWILGLPLELRLLVLAIFGCVAGSLCNLAIYRLAYRQRSISPWSLPLPDAPPRSWFDRLPILGWLSLSSREIPLHGRGFWIRPLLIEVGLAIALPLLYWWEIEGLGQLPIELQNLLRGSPRHLEVAQIRLHQPFVMHALLLLAMTIASFIDFDEKTIPDEVTIPGTLIGLVLIALLPFGMLPCWHEQMLLLVANRANIPPNIQLDLGTVWLTTPVEWPECFNGWPHGWSLVIGLGCFWLWCIGLLPRPWRTRHGYGRAWALMVARIRREPFSNFVLLIAVLGTVAVALVWWLDRHPATISWKSLLSGLVGICVSGGIIWLVRIIGRFALRKEAMGFGDVTLMAMIGLVVGWQASLMIFFIAPIVGLAWGLFQLVTGRGNELPYGPFLCMATLVVLWKWAELWTWAAPVFAMPELVPMTMAACMGMLLVLLTGLRLIRRG
ncbi:MAG: prepilin peptidase [Planctomycetota bacterium]|nr:prepilin peptidase [Planctomycetota bacterium]